MNRTFRQAVPSILILLIIAVTAVTIDQMVKGYIENAYELGHMGDIVYFNNLRIDYVVNDGCMYSFYAGHGDFFVVFNSCVLTILVISGLLVARQTPSVLPMIAFGLLVGGSIGNLMDRIQNGAVTDMFTVFSFNITVNVADLCLLTGGILLIGTVIWMFVKLVKMLLHYPESSESIPPAALRFFVKCGTGE